MLKIIYAFLLIFLCQISAFAQSEMEFAPVGAKWWYQDYLIQFDDSLYYSYEVPISIESVGDTIVNLIYDSEIIENVSLNYFKECSYYNNDLEYEEICTKRFIYCTDNGVCYQVNIEEDVWKSGSEFVIFDYTPSSDEILIYDTSNCDLSECTCSYLQGGNCPYVIPCLLYFEYVYKDDIIINEEIELPRFYYDYGTTVGEFHIGDTFIEYIGSDTYLFPCNKYSGYPSSQMLLCYQDENINYSTGVKDSCFFEPVLIFVNVWNNAEAIALDKVKIYPSFLLSDNLIYVENTTGEVLSYLVFDYEGNKLSEFTNKESFSFELYSNSSMYIVLILAENEIIGSQKIIKK